MEYLDMVDEEGRVMDMEEVEAVGEYAQVRLEPTDFPQFWQIHRGLNTTRHLTPPNIYLGIWEHKIGTQWSARG